MKKIGWVILLSCIFFCTSAIAEEIHLYSDLAFGNSKKEVRQYLLDTKGWSLINEADPLQLDYNGLEYTGENLTLEGTSIPLERIAFRFDDTDRLKRVICDIKLPAETFTEVHFHDESEAVDVFKIQMDAFLAFDAQLSQNFGQADKQYLLQTIDGREGLPKRADGTINIDELVHLFTEDVILFSNYTIIYQYSNVHIDMVICCKGSDYYFGEDDPSFTVQMIVAYSSTVPDYSRLIQ